VELCIGLYLSLTHHDLSLQKSGEGIPGQAGSLVGCFDCWVLVPLLK